MLARLTSAARRLFNRSRLDTDMADEHQFHLDARADELMQSGMSPVDAARRARIEFGNLDKHAERCRDEWGFRRLNERLADLRFAFRTFRRDRTFTLTVLGTLTLGIGITTSVFTVVKAVLIQPLPYREVERLVMLRNVNVEAGIDVEQARRGSGVFAADFAAWRDSAGIFDSLAAVHVEPRSHLGGAVKLTLADADPNAEPALVAFVSADFFKTVGVWPVAGRVFGDPGDVLLQDRYWHSRFDADPGVVGERVWHGYGEGSGWSSQWTVAGVMPAGFEVVSRAIDFLQALDIAEVARINGGHRLEAVIGRLRQGMPIEQAQARADAFSAHLARENPGRNRGWHIRLVPVAEDSAGEFRPFMTALFGAVVFMLLIICTNVANLLLAKAATRGKEIAVRVALGASRGRVVCHLLTESLVLAFVGATAGLGLAYAVVAWLRTSLPNRHTWGSSFLQADGIQIDGWVVAFAILAALLVGGLFGLIPAVRASSPNLEESLKDAGRGTMGTARGRQLGNVLISAQVMLSLALATGAGLLIRSAHAMYESGPGFAFDKRLLIAVKPFEYLRQHAMGRGLSKEQAQQAVEPQQGEAYWAARDAFREVLFERLRGIPVVDGVTSNSQGMRGSDWLSPFLVRPSSAGDSRTPTEAINVMVEANYFREMRMPLLRGRQFGPEDRAGSVPVAIVSADMARRLWPGQDAIDKQIQCAWRMGSWLTVVGVVGDTHDNGVDRPPVQKVFQPWAQNRWWPGHEYLVVRTTVDPLAVAPIIQRAVTDLDPDAGIMGIYRFEDVIRDSAWRLNHAMRLLSGLAGLSVLLSLIGIYGVLSHAVRERTREIGVRVALGARPLQVITLVLRQTTVVVAISVALGLALSVGVSRSLQALLFQVEPLDMAAFGGAALVLVLAAALASFFPARRAATLNPVTALRYD
jgi:putative ABC transport system permease protein